MMKNQVNMITKHIHEFHSRGTRPEAHQRIVLKILTATVDTTKINDFACARFVMLFLQHAEVQKHDTHVHLHV